MKSKELIFKEISEIKSQNTKLYSYLYNLVDLDWSNDVKFLEETYSAFIQDPRDLIKRIAICALLFGLKIQKNSYKEVALKYTQDIDCDYDLRLMCFSGLGEAYKGTKDKELLSSFYHIYRDVNDDEDLRGACFVAIMKVLGIDSVEILRKNNNVMIMSVNDIDEMCFIDEIDFIEKK